MFARARPMARGESLAIVPEIDGDADGLWSACQPQKARPISSSAQTATTICREADARLGITLPLAEKPTPERCQLTGFCGGGNEGKRKQIARSLRPIMLLCLM